MFMVGNSSVRGHGSQAHLSVTGGIWQVKGRPDVLKDIRIELRLHEESLTTHFVGQNKRFVFTPQQVSVEDEQGILIEKRDEPRRAFEGQRFETPWDDLHVAYFESWLRSTSMRSPSAAYINQPFRTSIHS
jgi:hypothetical protein